MKVLLYSPSFLPKVDGVSNRIQNHLRNVGPDVDVLLMCPDFTGTVSLLSGNVKMEEFMRFKVVRLPSWKPMNSLAPDTYLANPFALVRLWQIISAYQPDIIHFVGPDFYWLSLISIVKSVAQLRNIPVMLSYHQHTTEWIKMQPRNEVWKWFMRQVFQLEHTLKLSDFIISPSVQIQKYLTESRGIECHGVWPPAVDSRFFDCLQLPRLSSSTLDEQINIQTLRKAFTFNHHNPDECVLILYVGRMAYEKNISWIVDMSKSLKRANNVFFVFIGSGAIDEHLRTLHGRENKIFFSDGFWKGPILAHAYSACDIFAMPSSFETLGNVCLEAMSSGCVVVARNKGGIPDVVHHGQTGLLVDPDSFKGFQDVLTDIINFRHQLPCIPRRVLVDDILVKGMYPGNLYAQLMLKGYHYAHSSEKSWLHSTKTVESFYKKIIKDKKDLNARRPLISVEMVVVFLFLVFSVELWLNRSI